MNKFKIVILLGVLVSLWSVPSFASRQFNMEFANGVFHVKKMDYKNRIIYTNHFEFTYNANTAFIMGDNAAKAKASDIKKGSQIRLKVSNKVKSKRRPLLKEVAIRKLNRK